MQMSFALNTAAIFDIYGALEIQQATKYVLIHCLTIRDNPNISAKWLKA